MSNNWLQLNLLNYVETVEYCPQTENYFHFGNSFICFLVIKSNVDNVPEIARMALS